MYVQLVSLHKLDIRKTKNVINSARRNRAAERGTSVENTKFHAKHDQSGVKGCYKAFGRCNPNSLIEEKVKSKGTQCCTELLTNICRPQWQISITQVRRTPWKSVKQNDGRKKRAFCRVTGAIRLIYLLYARTDTHVYSYNFTGKKKIISACCYVYMRCTSCTSK